LTTGSFRQLELQNEKKDPSDQINVFIYIKYAHGDFIKALFTKKNHSKSFLGSGGTGPTTTTTDTAASLHIDEHISATSYRMKHHDSSLKSQKDATSRFTIS
jgi:hypothetical protein